MVSEENPYVTQFHQSIARLPGRGLAWLGRLRESGMDHFLDLGFPTTRMEDRKYTNVGPISRTTFQSSSDQSKVSISETSRLQLGVFPAPRLAFTNGTFDQRNSSPRQSSYATPDVYIAGLADSLVAPDVTSLLERHLGRYVGMSDRAFVAWNTAFFADGACVVVPPRTTVHDPIHLVFATVADGPPRAIFPRNVIIVGEESQVAVVEIFLSAAEGVYLTNTVTEVVAGAGATIDYYNVELESRHSFHVATIHADLKSNANLRSHFISLRAGLNRNELQVVLDGEGSDCTLNGLFLASGHRLVDNHTVIDHRRPHATSRELYKGILAGHGQGVFNGAIVVRRGAQKTNAVQHSKNLLLSENAQINSKPQLEIRADDVRCSHGASIGQLDQDALFYLKTRGIEDHIARRILVRGFAAEITEGIRLRNIRDEVEARIDNWFESGSEET
jgi:Fe-S cluster assembly protein SufD